MVSCVTLDECSFPGGWGEKSHNFSVTGAPARDVPSTLGYELHLNWSFESRIRVHSHKDNRSFKRPL